jgi:hypothetical protein
LTETGGLAFTFTRDGKVERIRVRGRTRLSRKHQATIPVEALRQAGLRAGDEAA